MFFMTVLPFLVLHIKVFVVSFGGDRSSEGKISFFFFFLLFKMLNKQELVYCLNDSHQSSVGHTGLPLVEAIIFSQHIQLLFVQFF